MEEELRALIQAAPGISGVVQSVDWGVAAEGVPYPLIMLQGVGSTHLHNQTGPESITQSRVQVDVYALSFGEAKVIARAVRRVLDGYQGGVIRGIFLISQRDGREGGTNEADRPYFSSMDIGVSHFFE